jgi:hypothetical protein
MKKCSVHSDWNTVPKKYSEIYFENSKTKSHFQCWQLKPCIKLLGLNGWVKLFTSHVFRAWNRSDHESNILLIRNSMVSFSKTSNYTRTSGSCNFDRLSITHSCIFFTLHSKPTTIIPKRCFEI